MTAYDQFETEPYVFYSGSMADNVMFGDVFSNNQEDSRSQIASGVSGIISSSFYSKLMTRNERLGFISNKKKPKPFVALAATSEVYQDSILPAISDIIQTNGIEVASFSGSIQATTAQGLLAGATSLSYGDRPRQSNNSINILFSGTGTPLPTSPLIPFVNAFTDGAWVNSFPFMSLYKRLPAIPAKYRLNTPKMMSKDIFDNILSQPIQSDEIGNINVVVPFKPPAFSPYTNLGIYTNIWGVVNGSPINSSLKFNRIHNLMYDNVVSLAFNPFPAASEVSTTGSYAAFGYSGAILVSGDGNNWSVAQNLRNAFIPTGWPSFVTSPPHYSCAVPIGYNGRKHWKWVLIGNRLSGTAGRGRVILEKTGFGLPGNPVITSQTQFEDMTPSLSFYLSVGEDDIDVHGVLVLRDLDGNPSPAYTGAMSGPADSLCFFGRRIIGTGPHKSFIFFTDRNVANGTKHASEIDDYVWTAAVKRVGTASVWFVGSITGGANKNDRTAGCVGVLSNSTSGNAPTAMFNDRTSLANDAWPAATIPPCWGIDTDQATRTIIVGDDGMILRCTSATGASSWSRLNPAGGYVGSFSSVKWIDGSGATSRWIITGDGGEVQISTDGGDTWVKATTEEPNTHVPFSNQKWMSDSTFPGQKGFSKSQLALAAATASALGEFRPILRTSHRNMVVRCSELKENSLSGLPDTPNYISIGGVAQNPIDINVGIVLLGYLIVRIVDELSSPNDNVILRLSEGVPRPSSNPCVRPDSSTTNKYFFGYGDGIRIDLSDTAYGQEFVVPQSKGKVGNITNHTYYDMYGPPSLAQVNGHEVEIRGYRYGAAFHEPLPTSAVYRYGRFGQFRDMLEQRPYTKIWNGFRALEAPVTVNFVSGTIDYDRAVDYVTNTNPSYDPRDSGFWDYEYRSGQPFYDIDNID